MFKKALAKKNLFIIILAGLIFLNLGFIFAQTNKNVLDNFVILLRDLLLKKETKPELPTSNSLPQKPIYNINDLESQIIEVVERASPAVVSIIISKYVPVIEKYYLNPFQDLLIPPELKPFFQFEFKIPQYQEKGLERKDVGAGTGFIIRSDGLILTNKHVVNDPKAEYTVYLKDGKKYSAKVLAIHPNDDLAIIKINADNLPTLPIGNSDKIRLGQ